MRNTRASRRGLTLGSGFTHSSLVPAHAIQPQMRRAIWTAGTNTSIIMTHWEQARERILAATAEAQPTHNGSITLTPKICNHILKEPDAHPSSTFCDAMMKIMGIQQQHTPTVQAVQVVTISFLTRSLTIFSSTSCFNASMSMSSGSGSFAVDPVVFISGMPGMAIAGSLVAFPT